MLCSSRAIFFSLTEYSQYPIARAKEYYDLCEFWELQPNLENLNKLLELGDIYCFEPTGSYSWVWHDNLLANGKEVRLISHNKIASWRGVCGWSAKDDYHDALVCAYYGWSNISSHQAFNRVRVPETQAIYRLFLEKERYVKEYRVVTNRARNLLHHEFPEVRNVGKGNNTAVHQVWPYIAGLDVSKKTKTRYDRKLIESIGTAKVKGFSTELKDKAKKINDLQIRRIEITRHIEELLKSSIFEWYLPVLNKFEFGPLEKGIILSQIYPFEQFLGDDNKEIRIKKRNGYTKRISYARFHSFLGKAPHPNSSGNKEGVIVNGQQLARNMLMTWANRCICRTSWSNSKKPFLDNEIGERLHTAYLSDSQQADALLQMVSYRDSDEALEVLAVLRKMKDNKPAQILVNILEKAMTNKKKKKEAVKKDCNNALVIWAKARIGDKAVKLLFKELFGAYRGI